MDEKYTFLTEESIISKSSNTVLPEINEIKPLQAIQDYMWKATPPNFLKMVDSPLRGSYNRGTHKKHTILRKRSSAIMLWRM
ncbi:MAG: hypothetical protein AB7Y74_07200 [Syntrophorhabdus sp.]|jgi:hypothetical protein